MPSPLAKDNSEESPFIVMLSFSPSLSDPQLSVRRKNTKEKMGSLWKGFSKSFDESMVLKNQKDVDPWFEEEKKFLTEYHTA